MVYGQGVARPADARGRVWLHLASDTRLGLQPAAAGQAPSIEHYAIKVDPFDRNALTARLRALRVDVLPSNDEPDVVRFQDNNGIVVELRVAG